MSVSNYLYNYGYPRKLRARTFVSDIQVDIRADIGATYIGAWFTMDIRGCTDNSTRISIILRMSKRISARTVRPGHTSIF